MGASLCGRDMVGCGKRVWWERCPHVHAHMVDEMDRNVVKWERLVTGKNL